MLFCYPLCRTFQSSKIRGRFPVFAEATQQMFSRAWKARQCSCGLGRITMAPIMKTFFILALVIGLEGRKLGSPPHCTRITKETDYESRFQFKYPTVYLIPGQREAYQPMHCISPPAVNKAETVVCDWVAPPMVEFTLGDDYVHVIRQDPSGRYAGNAEITTYQLCNHNLPPHHSANKTFESNEIPQVEKK